MGHVESIVDHFGGAAVTRAHGGKRMDEATRAALQLFELFEATGRELKLDSVALLAFDTRRRWLQLRHVWRADQQQVHNALRIPSWLFRPLGAKRANVFSLETLPRVARPIAGPIMRRFGTRCALLVAVGAMDRPLGFLVGTSNATDRILGTPEQERLGTLAERIQPLLAGGTTLPSRPPREPRQ